MLHLYSVSGFANKPIGPMCQYKGAYKTSRASARRLITSRYHHAKIAYIGKVCIRSKFICEFKKITIMTNIEAI